MNEQNALRRSADGKPRFDAEDRPRVGCPGTPSARSWARSRLDAAVTPRGPERRARPRPSSEPFLPELVAPLSRPERRAALGGTARAGFTGGYTVVRRAGFPELAPGRSPFPVLRFETAPEVEAQMDYSPFDIDFAPKDAVGLPLPSAMCSAIAPQFRPLCRIPDFATTSSTSWLRSIWALSRRRASRTT